MGSPKYTQDEIARMRNIMLRDLSWGSPEYNDLENPVTTNLPHVDSPIQQVEFKNFVETKFSGSVSFDRVYQIDTNTQQIKDLSFIQKESATIIETAEEKIEQLEKSASSNMNKKNQEEAPNKFRLSVLTLPDVGSKAIKTIEIIGKTTEETISAAWDLLKLVLGREKDQKIKEKDTQKQQEEMLINRQNIATVEQAIKKAQAIHEARTQGDFQRIAGDEVVFMSDETKKKVLNLQVGLGRKFTAKDAMDLRIALIEQKKAQEKQKAALAVKSASKGPNLDKNLAQEQGVHSIYNTPG